ncbi:MAG: 30S ribosomal protein S16 [Planctomycetota bacterium]|nr:30S ribosomal protein S16 [Planctomycetota bacterium]MDA1178084.1 30S ribosomal protein S16 [Planctomycetota bacterium]
MAVRIRLKRMGRTHRPFYRVCAMDARSPRDGKAIEELGFYDPMVRETDARAVLNAERIDYWIGVGAQPSEKVRVLIKKYGTQGTHLQAQQLAFERMKIKPQAPPPVKIEIPKPEPVAVAESTAAESSNDGESASE